MSKQLKQMMADDLRADLEGNDDILVVGLLPMNAEQTLELRTKIREQGARFRVIHNRTARHAIGEDRSGLAEYFTGMTALAFGGEPIPVAKALVEAAKKKIIEVRGAYVEGEFLDSSGFELLAESPDKPTLRGMLAGVIIGSGRGIAVALSGVGGGIARCLQAKIDKSGESAETE